jgi:hypothetical protein
MKTAKGKMKELMHNRIDVNELQAVINHQKRNLVETKTVLVY